MSAAPAAGAPRRVFILGTRSSALALWQAEWARAALSAAAPDCRFVLSPSEAAGDAAPPPAAAAAGSLPPGLWTSALAARLAAGEVDIVVHSLKDVPTASPPGLALAAVGPREDPRDALLLPAAAPPALRAAVAAAGLAALPAGALLGSAAVRRAALLGHAAPALRCAAVRGNLATRLRKLDEAGGGYDALLLAAAGVRRLGWQARLSALLEGGDWPWGVGQGAVGLECRAGDGEALAVCHAVAHPAAALACLAERAFLARLQGGCQKPIGVYTWYAPARSGGGGSGGGGSGGGGGGGGGGGARLDACGDDDRAYPPGGAAATLTIRGSVLANDGSALYCAEASRAVQLPRAPLDEATWRALGVEAAALGGALAQRVLSAGAAELLGPLCDDGAEARPLSYGSAECAGGGGGGGGGGDSVAAGGSD